MKMPVLMCGVLMTWMAWCATAARAQEVREEVDNVSAFMRAKLTHSQKVLEGLTVEDFDGIARHAQELALLSQATQWQVLQTPEYARRSAEFRRAADDLKTAAQKKNLDGATLAFVNVTMKCVECHKYVRSVRNASLDRPFDGFASSAKGPDPLRDTRIFRSGSDPIADDLSQPLLRSVAR